MSAQEVSPEARSWLKKVLGVEVGDAGASPQSQTPPPRISPRVAFMQSRLMWDATRKQVQAELQELEQAVLTECEEEEDFSVIAANSKILYTVLDALDERLIDTLDDALNAADPEERRKLETEARTIIDEYTSYLAADELLRDIDDNGFTDTAIRETVTKQLDAISRNLKSLGA